jgi:hypothetical protein
MARYLYPQQCGKSEGLAWKDWVARRLGTQVGAVLSVAHPCTEVSTMTRDMPSAMAWNNTPPRPPHPDRPTTHRPTD